jgi:phosphoglycolate phosphatase
MRTHLLIDLDGTLSDSSPGIARSLQHAFARCGFPPPSDEQVRGLIGPPFEETFPALGVTGPDIERVILAYRERYEDVGLFENALYPGVASMVEQLADDHTLAIATAKPEPTALRIVEHFGLDHHFAVQAGATVEVNGSRRTKAQVIEYALAMLAIEAGDHVVMIGDRDHDVDGARSHGIDCIGVAWGFGGRAELERAGAVAIVDRPEEVADAVAATYRAGRR